MAGEQKATLRFGVVDKASAAIQQIKGRVSGLTSPIERVKSVMDKLGHSRAFQEAGKAAAMMRERVDVLQGALMRATAITGAVAGVGLLAKTTADAAEQIGGFASRYQVSAEAIQVYASLISSAGGTADNVAEAMGSLGEAMADAFSGDEDAAQAFEAIGIGLDDLRSMSREQILEKMADAFSKSENAIAKQAIVLKLMGEDGTFFMETLNGGAEEYQKKLAELREDGGIVSDEEIENSKAFNAAVGRLSQTVSSIKTDFGLAAAQKLLPLVEKIRVLIYENRAAIDQVIGKIADRLPGFIETFGQVAGEAFAIFGQVLSVVGAIVEKIGTVPSAAIALAMAFGPSIVAVGKIGVQVAKVIAMAVAGVGAIPAAFIAAGGAMVVALVKNWDEVCAYVTGAWERVKEGFSKGIFDGLMTAFDELTTGLLNAIFGTIKSTIDSFGLGRFLPDWLREYTTFRSASVTAKDKGGASSKRAEVQVAPAPIDSVRPPLPDKPADIDLDVGQVPESSGRRDLPETVPQLAGARLAYAQTQQKAVAQQDQKVQSYLKIQVESARGAVAKVAEVTSDGLVEVSQSRTGKAFTGDLYAY